MLKNTVKINLAVFFKKNIKKLKKPLDFYKKGLYNTFKW